MPNNRGVKLGNEYAREFGALYEQTPKAVFAAIAYSMCFIDAGERGTDAALALFIAEWKALHDNKIVPQKPPKERVNDISEGR